MQVPPLSLIESFVTLVMKTRVLDERRERNYGRVSAEESPGRTDDGRVVRDFKLELTAREV